MGFILHMSDFHLGRNWKFEAERLSALAKWINEQDIQIHYLVFTGDIVDARIIKEDCLAVLIQKYSDEFKGLDVKKYKDNADIFLERIKESGITRIEEYNKLLEETAKKKIDKAIAVFKVFLDTIRVSYDRFITCCGNHDRLRYLKETEDSLKCDNDHRIDEHALFADYEPYVRFCNAFGNRISYKTTVYRHEGVNFIIANSNWRAPTANETNNMCIHCGEIVETLSKLEQAPGFTRTSNIFIAHKPFDDICENAKFPYDGQMLTVRELIERATVMFLHGDKHSYVTKVNNWLKEFMCGLPLVNDGVCYNLIDYDPSKGTISSKYIMYTNDQWGLVPISECMKKIYDLSSDHLKKLAFDFLRQGEQHAANWNDAISLIQRAMKEGRFDLAAQMFGACGTLYNDKQEKIRYGKYELFNQVFSLMHSSQEWRVFAIKGEPGTGKTTFLTLEYLFMLWKFYRGESRYAPFYFDFDCLTNSVDNESNEEDGVVGVEAVINRCVEKFEVFLNEVIALGDEQKIPLCIIVDGLDTQNMLIDTGLSLEARIYRILESRLKGTSSKCIMGLNTHRTALFDKSFDQVKRFHYVLFINEVHIVPYKKNSRYEDFLHAYMELKGRGSSEEYIELVSALKKLRRISVNLSFLHKNSTLLFDVAAEESSWKAMRRQVRRLVEREENLFEMDSKALCRVAFLTTIRGESYQGVCDEDGLGSLQYSDFILIRNNPDIAEFLVARHYLEELNNYTTSKISIPQDSILYCFVPRDLAVMIRLLMEELGFRFRGLKSFVERHGAELNGYLGSTIVYLAGHCKEFGSAGLVKVVQPPKNETNEFFTLCDQRSRELAMICCDGTNIELVNNFLCSLMDNQEYRAFHRAYQLWYYQDISNPLEENREAWSVSKSKGVGFDFYNCFLVLVSKMDYCFENNAPYPMLEIDLFTLCDLIYSRLQDFSDKRSLFYSPVYNREGNSVSLSVLQRMNNLLVEYLSRYGKERGINSRIQSYFTFMQGCFVQAMDKLMDRVGKPITKPLVSAADNYGAIVRLHNRPRVCWNISEEGTVFKKNQPRYSPSNIMGMPEVCWGAYAPVRETMGQHILECLFIAQMFLPEKTEDGSYKKERVMSLLLMSEMGKLKTDGDYTTEYKNVKASIQHEKEGVGEILTLGAMDGYANLSSLFEALTAGVAKENPSDINMRICLEIKAIQREYKYYTLYGELGFSKERHDDFAGEFVDLHTTICKEIRKKLIQENPMFQEYFIH